MTVEQGIDFFAAQPRISAHIKSKKIFRVETKEDTKKEIFFSIFFGFFKD